MLVSHTHPDWYQNLNDFLIRNRIEGRTGAIDEANIPVDLSLKKLASGYKLSWSNYMPRKEMVWHEPVSISCISDKPLREFIQKFILPIYQGAVTQLESIVSGDSRTLYFFWPTGPQPLE